MKILFLTLARIESIEAQGIYPDLLRKFRDNGHELTIVCPNERKYRNKTKYIREGNVSILNVWTTNIQKTNLIEKGITTILIDNQYDEKKVNANFECTNFEEAVNFILKIY